MVAEKMKRVREKNFCMIKQMPPQESNQSVCHWIYENEIVMNYVMNLIKKVMIYDNKTQKWKGMNFGVSQSVKFSETVKLGWSKKVYGILENAGIDRMPPLYLRYPNQDFNLYESEIYHWIKEKDDLFLFLIKVASFSKLIRKNKDNRWQGVDYKEDFND